jgi:polyphenol oxidase
MSGPLAILRSAALAAVPHGFSSRAPLDPADVMPGAPLVMARQVHSARVLAVSAPWEGAPPEADGLVTATRGLLIGVVTADCAPVLLADPDAAVVGAAHAGWRGALGGVIENTVAAMVAIGAARERIAAAIGPAIAQASYEVDDALRARFPAAAAGFFAPGRPGHWQFDLPGFVASRLRQAGVAAVDDLAEDTYAQENRFFSYRRATPRGAATAGRQTSVIGLS